jgi:murein L,D-transpeptidase YafK
MSDASKVQIISHKNDCSTSSKQSNTFVDSTQEILSLKQKKLFIVRIVKAKAVLEIWKN